jgi:cytochrome c-type biogenesis protein CcmE
VIVAIVAIVAVAGFVLVNALGNATLFFYNADEAVAQRAELGTSRFRLQGTVVDGTIERSPDGVEFDVTFNGAVVPVRHQGDPPELFEPDIPVVLEGRFATAPGGAEGEQAGSGAATAPDDDLLFLSDRMLVKHTNEYDAENEDRLRQAEEGGDVPAGAASSTDGGAGQATER